MKSILDMLTCIANTPAVEPPTRVRAAVLCERMSGGLGSIFDALFKVYGRQ